MFPAILTSPLAIRVMGVAALAAMVGWGVWVIRDSGRAACELENQAAFSASLQRGIEQAQAIAKQDAEVSEYYERWRTKEIVKWQTMVEEVTRDITPDCAKCGLSPDGMRTLNDIRRSGPSPTDPGKPDGGMPTPHATPEPTTPGIRSLPGAGQPHVQRLLHEASAAGGCDS